MQKKILSYLIVLLGIPAVILLGATVFSGVKYVYFTLLVSALSLSGCGMKPTSSGSGDTVPKGTELTVYAPAGTESEDYAWFIDGEQQEERIERSFHTYKYNPFLWIPEGG